MEALSHPARPGLALSHLAILPVMILASLLLGSEAGGQVFRRSGGAAVARAPRSAPRFAASTAHFVVNAPDPVLARKIGQEAERLRKELAIQWLGHELGQWDDKCPIFVELSMHSGGETSFAFVTDSNEESRPRSWKMTIFGTPERLLDSVLPHEVTHTIFASHFGRPLPRWADEGACTIVEHESERAKNHQMLIDFLHTNRGIPFNRMYEMKQYPNDILPLYAQGHSLSKFLVMKKGRRHFLDYIADGMYNEERGPLLQGWNRSTEKFYGFRDLSTLQEAWIDWVRTGSQETELASKSNNPSDNPQTFVVAPIPGRSQTEKPKQILRVEPELEGKDNESESKGQPVQYASDSWYVRQSRSQRESSQKLPMDSGARSASAPSDGKLTFQPMNLLTRQQSESSTAANKHDVTLWR